MKMKPKVTMATASLLQLALLSSITSVEFHPLNGDPTGVPNKKRESLIENCDGYKNISKWFDLQDAAANSLQRYYDNLEESLGYLTGRTASTNCCPYDKDLMHSVMDNINIIDQQNGNNESTTLSPSGDMRTDLNKIIPRIKKLVTQDFESCCSKMEESLNKIKKNFKDHLKNVKEKLKSEASDEFSKDRKELEEKHQSLRDKIKDTKESLAKLETKTMRSGHQTRCCAELNTKTEALEKQIEAVGTATKEKMNQFESQLKDIENMLVALKKRVKGAKNTLETQGQAVEKELESCGKEFEKFSKTPNNNHNCCESCLDELVNRLKELEERVTSVINNMNKLDSNNGTSCMENLERLDNIKDLTNKSEILKSGNNSLISIISALGSENLKDRTKELEQKVQDLQQAANESQICCKNIVKLNTFAEHLQNKTEEMQKIMPDLLKQNKLEFEDIKKQFKETLNKLDNAQNNNKDIKKLKNLEAMLQKVNSELKAHEVELSKFLNQKNKDNLIGDFENKSKEFDQFWLEVDGRSSHLEDQQNALDPIDRLMKQHKELNQSLDKFKLSLEDLQQQEKQYQNELEKLNQLENQVTKCLNACKEVPKMHDLIKKVNDIVQAVQDKNKPGVKGTSKISNILKIPKHTKN